MHGLHLMHLRSATMKYTILRKVSYRAGRRSAGAGAPAYFAGAGVGKLRQKLRQTKL
jgi:hypothetical protein